MSPTESKKKVRLEADSDIEEDEVQEEVVPHVEVDATKLTPLSPEVISKQVSSLSSYVM